MISFETVTAPWLRRTKSAKAQAYATCDQCDWTYASPEAPRSVAYVGRQAKAHGHYTGHTTEVISIRRYKYVPMTQQEYEQDLKDRAERASYRHGRRGGY